MSLGAIIALVIAAISALLGALFMRPIAKASGRKEGAEQANQEQQIIQAQATVKAVQERSDVDQKVATTPRADIDRELSEFSRPD